MNERAEFLGKLNELVTLARANGNQIGIEDVKNFFEKNTLQEEQLELVFEYLLTQKVVVKGYLKMDAAAEKEEVEFTEAEKAYLSEYESDLKAFQVLDTEEKQILFKEMIQGNEQAKKRLIEAYLPEVVEIAKDMYCEEIFLGDMIQEGNVGLIMGMELVMDEASAHDTVVSQIRQSIQMLMKEQEEFVSKDKKMIEKVSQLDESIKALTEELGRKVSLDELAVYMGMEEEEIEDILRLMGEESEEENKEEHID